MTKAEIKRIISEFIQGKMMTGDIRPDGVPDLISFIEEAIDNRDQELVNNISLLIRDWEEAMGKEDKTLYTLGMRRVIDMLREEKYKPLSENDYRDFKRPFEVERKTDE